MVKGHGEAPLLRNGDRKEFVVFVRQQPQFMYVKRKGKRNDTSFFNVLLEVGVPFPTLTLFIFYYKINISTTTSFLIISIFLNFMFYIFLPTDRLTEFSSQVLGINNEF